MSICTKKLSLCLKLLGDAMKMYTLVFILLLFMLVIPDIFFYFKLKNSKTKPIFIILHLLGALFFTAAFIYVKFGMEYSQNFRIVGWIMWMYFFFLLIYIPKLIHIIFYFFNFIFKKIYKRDTSYFNYIRIPLSIFIIVVMLVSAYITPRNFEVNEVEVAIPDLPAAFDGYRIAQISDIHLGSWGAKYSKLKTVVRLINKQQPDIIVFTGDMVNNFSGETKGWAPYFNELNKKSAKFAVLGNHDYGDYTDWRNEEERIQNRVQINKAITDFGFRLLLNENVYLRKGTDSLLLVGVENWGKSEKARYSDLRKALKGSSATEPKILLSHDPNHWEAEVIGRKDIVLTLAGHTHAAQLGIKVGNRLFSPAAFVFKYWEGLYKVNQQYLYVNRGIGYIGLPMQIGVQPEITIIVLRRK